MRGTYNTERMERIPEILNEMGCEFVHDGKRTDRYMGRETGQKDIGIGSKNKETGRRNVCVGGRGLGKRNGR